jgi:hypothetical protein
MIGRFATLDEANARERYKPTNCKARVNSQGDQIVIRVESRPYCAIATELAGLPGPSLALETT